MLWVGRGLTVLIGAFIGYLASGMVAGTAMYGGLFLLFLLRPSAKPHIPDGVFSVILYGSMAAGVLAGAYVGALVSRDFVWRGHGGRKEA